jgi:hypothetical protein
MISLHRPLLIHSMDICHTVKYDEVCDWVLTYVIIRAVIMHSYPLVVTHEFTASPLFTANSVVYAFWGLRY